MDIKYYENYEYLSEEISDTIHNQIKTDKKSSLCLATGASPLIIYNKLTQKIKNANTDVNELTIIKLDEWCGGKMADDGTCESFLRQNIINPLDIKIESYISFDCESKNYEDECARISNLVDIIDGGIDLTILGLGKNGHIGLNEPAENIPHRAHVSILDKITKTHDMLKGKSGKVTKGMTLGFYEILNSKQIIFIVAGEGKKKSFNDFVESNLSTHIPSTFLKLHKNITCFVDKNAIHN